MNQEQLDEEHRDIMQLAVLNLFKFLDKEIPESEKYSHLNLALNVIIGALSTISFNFISIEGEEEFLKTIVTQIKESMDCHRVLKLLNTKEKMNG